MCVIGDSLAVSLGAMMTAPPPPPPPPAADRKEQLRQTPQVATLGVKGAAGGQHYQLCSCSLCPCMES